MPCICVSDALRGAIDAKMRAAVHWAAAVYGKDGVPVLDSTTVKQVFKSPAWGNRGGVGVRSVGLRVLLGDEGVLQPVEVAWSWLYHSRGCDVFGDFQRYSRGGDRSCPMIGWQERACRLVQWDTSFSGCSCDACNGGVTNTTMDDELLLGLQQRILTCLLAWSVALLHGVWCTADGTVRLGHGARAALWDKFGTTYRPCGGVAAFQAALDALAALGCIAGDLHSTRQTTALPQDATEQKKRCRRGAGRKPRKMITRVERPMKRARKSVLIDIFSGFQSLALLAGVLSLSYVSIDISAVLVAGTSTFSATLVEDLCLIEHGCIVQHILSALGIAAEWVAFLWCSPPCRTFGPTDATNSVPTIKRPEPCNYRDHTPGNNRPPRVSRFPNDPYRALALLHDRLVRSLVASLLTCGLSWVIENPAGSLARRPYMEKAGLYTLVHYCAFVGSYFHKPTHLWNSTKAEMSLEGFAGHGSTCGKDGDTCYCGHVNGETGQWNHDNVIGGRTKIVVTDPASSVLRVKNSVPKGLQLAVAAHFGLYHQ